MINTILIDADSSSAGINCRYVEQYGKLNLRSVFSDFDEALEYLEKNRTELVIIDEQANADALAFIRKAHNRDIVSRFIVITAEGDTDAISNMFFCGVFDVITKPFDYDAFRSVLDRFFACIINPASTPHEPALSAHSRVITDDDREIEQQILKELEKESLSVSELAKILKKHNIVIHRCINDLIDKRAVIPQVGARDGVPAVLYSKL